ncbi:hypothetical protein HZC30_02745 [Candidatus Woesearchaeota archaeon]|nr:hypothetical protein [Candidatus Woesearchaeota archaeon]
MLQPEQEIIYFREEQEISRITSQSAICSELENYLLNEQPRLKPGEKLRIPLPQNDFQYTNTILRVEAEESHLVCYTQNLTYTIRYVNLDLKKLRGHLPELMVLKE